MLLLKKSLMRVILTAFTFAVLLLLSSSASAQTSCAGQCQYDEESCMANANGALQLCLVSNEGWAQSCKEDAWQYYYWCEDDVNCQFGSWGPCDCGEKYELDLNWCNWQSAYEEGRCQADHDFDASWCSLAYGDCVQACPP